MIGLPQEEDSWGEKTQFYVQPTSTTEVKIREMQNWQRQAEDVSIFAAAHGDAFPFDGHPGSVLVRAFQPGEGIGEMHFDEDEEWTAGKHSSSVKMCL